MYCTQKYMEKTEESYCTDINKENVWNIFFDLLRSEVSSYFLQHSRLSLQARV